MKKFFKNITISLLAAASLYGVNGCNKFLDVVPDDGLASIENSLQPQIDSHQVSGHLLFIYDK